MSIKDSIANNLPIPNPNNGMWISLTLGVIGNIARANNIYSLALSLYALFLFLVGLLVLKISVYVISVYKQRLFEKGPHVRVFMLALIVALFLFAIGFSMVFSGDYSTNEQGRVLVAHTFGFFAVFVSVYDWWLDRPQAKALSSLKTLSAEEVIKMHKVVQATKDPR